MPVVGEGRYVDDQSADGVQREDLVVVPNEPGPLATLDGIDRAGRRDDLDELIDDLFPVVDDGPGWFDIGLLALGVAMVATGLIGVAPAAVTVIGLIALGVGVILPVRWVWQQARAQRRQQRRRALLGGGRPLDISSPETERLAAAYDDLLRQVATLPADLRGTAAAAGHAAVVEVASLLEGRPPTTVEQRNYVAERTTALAEVVAVIGTLDARATGERDLDSSDAPDLLVAARRELDRLSPDNSLTRLTAVTDDARARGDVGQ